MSEEQRAESGDPVAITERTKWSVDCRASVEPQLDPPDFERLSSRSITQIAAALHQAQAIAGPQKIERNLTGFMPTKSGGYEYKYSGLDVVTKATASAQAESGLSLFTPLRTTARGDGMQFFLMHTSGEWLNYGWWPLREAHQIIGGGMTYGRRYMEGAVYKISPVDDDDARAATEDYRERQQRTAQREDDRQQRSGQRSRPPQQRQGSERRAESREQSRPAQPSRPAPVLNDQTDVGAWERHDLTAYLGAVNTTTQLRTVLDRLSACPVWLAHVPDWQWACKAIADRYRALRQSEGCNEDPDLVDRLKEEHKKLEELNNDPFGEKEKPDAQPTAGGEASEAAVLDRREDPPTDSAQ